MKTQIKIVILALITLVTIEAHAQTQKQAEPSLDLNTQITMTQDFVNSMLNQLSTTSVDRMNLSKDYSLAGPELQNRIKIKLDTFRSAISMIFSGTFSQLINEYNQVAQDKSISPEELASKKSVIFESLSQLAKAVQASYQAQLASLFRIEKRIYLTYKNYKGNCEETIVFADKFKTTISVCNEQNDIVTPITSVVVAQMKKLLLQKCSTQTCFSNLFTDYASYFSQIQNYINKPVVITLADSKIITINPINTDENIYAMSLISHFQFGKEYTALPFSN